MASNWFVILLEISTIACGLVAGVFLSFSDFVMRSLNGARTSAGVEVMQVINREVFKSIFMFLLLGWSAISPLMAIYAWFYLAGPVVIWVVAGGLFYTFGVFVVSLVFNVPMNKQLEALYFADTPAETYWHATYLPRWTFWNYVRAISSTISAVCFMAAAVMISAG